MDSALDLDGYFDRIGYGGSTQPNLEFLAALSAHHVSSIPFENCSVLLGRSIDLDLPSLQRKLVTDRHGGYCFEQNGFVLEVLTALGFDARPLSARVRIGIEDGVVTPRTHMFNVVKLDGAEWLVDCGVGALSLASPIRWEADAVQATPHEPRRIIVRNGTYVHQFERGGVWGDVYEFTGEPMPLVDREVANWYTSTHPKSRFKQALFCALSSGPGERKTILGAQFNHRRGPETLRTIELTDQPTALQVLGEEFGLEFPAETSFPL